MLDNRCFLQCIDFTVKSILSVCALEASSFHIALFYKLNIGPALASKLFVMP